MDKTGFKIDDEWVGSLFLVRFPERFSSMIMTIEQSGFTATADGKSKLDMDTDGDVIRTAGALDDARSRTSKKKDRDPSETSCFKCKQLDDF